MMMARFKKMIDKRLIIYNHEKLWRQEKKLAFIMNINKHNIISR